jgi:hypothetical protein
MFPADDPAVKYGRTNGLGKLADSLRDADLVGVNDDGLAARGERRNVADKQQYR